MKNSFLPKLGQPLSRRKENLFSKKVPKTRKRLFIVMALALSAATVYGVRNQIFNGIFDQGSMNVVARADIDQKNK